MSPTEQAAFEKWFKNCNATRRASGVPPMSRMEAMAKWFRPDDRT